MRFGRSTAAITCVDGNDQWRTTITRRMVESTLVRDALFVGLKWQVKSSLDSVSLRESREIICLTDKGR